MLYHFMHPDDVAGGVHFDDLAQGLAERGWAVEARPSNRSCRNANTRFARSETHRGVRYRRVWRPDFDQSRALGRLANSLWLILAWSSIGLGRARNAPDAIVVGTDPMFAALVAIPLRLLKPKTVLIHWCLDLHPEAAVASGVLSENSFPVKIARRLMRAAYRRFDLIADLGACMRGRLRRYGHPAEEAECPPWAISEPSQIRQPDSQTRRELFGDASIAVLYSGNFGEAHGYRSILKLARRLRDEVSVHFCFAIRGNRAAELADVVEPSDTNITFASFASTDELEKRLASADIHLASLLDEYSGVALPSKFIGSIASGRPVIFAGPETSAISGWIKRYEIGWLLTDRTLENVAQALTDLSLDKERLHAMQSRAFDTYRSHFAREKLISEFSDCAARLVDERC